MLIKCVDQVCWSSTIETKESKTKKLLTLPDGKEKGKWKEQQQDDDKPYFAKDFSLEKNIIKQENINQQCCNNTNLPHKWTEYQLNNTKSRKIEGNSNTDDLHSYFVEVLVLKELPLKKTRD